MNEDNENSPYRVGAAHHLRPAAGGGAHFPRGGETYLEQSGGADGFDRAAFYIKDEETPNAWVTNGESVTVTTGLLNMLDTEAELYAVFAHEAGHVRLNHMHKSASRGAGLSIAAAILGQLLGGDLAGTAVNVGANLVNSGWSREQEIEADDYSVELAVKNGEDPVGMYSAISKLAKVNNTQPSGFNSHPPDDRRLLHIKNKILELKPGARFPE